MRTLNVLRIAPFALLACDSYGAEEAKPPPAGDAGTADAGEVCAERALYVSQSAGNDSNDGCTKEKPIKSIGAALALAAAKKLDGYEIRVCGGVYAEQGVRVTMPVSLRGAYNCVTWTRGPENTTRIENAAYPTSPATLTVAGATLGRDVVVDGFAVSGAPSGPAAAVAVLVEEGAKPLLSNLDIVGGGTSADAGSSSVVGSLGLVVRKGASPEVAASGIRGGSGSATVGVGSAGVYVDAGAAIDLHDSNVESGTGSGPIGAIAVVFVDAAKSRIATTRITFGGSASKGQAGVGGVGIHATGGELSVTESTLRGAVTTCTDSSTCSSVGVVAEGGAKIDIHRSAVYAGDVATTTAPSSVFAVSFGKDAEATLTSSVIHAGATISDPDTESVAVDLAATKSAKIVGNTLLFSGSTAKVRVGIRVAAPTGPGSGTGGNEVVGNVFVAAGGPSDIALAEATCGGAKLDVVTHNAFVSPSIVLLDTVGGNCVPGSAIGVTTNRISDTQSHLATHNATAQSNVMIRPNCANECIAGASCADAASCAKRLFPTWDATGGLTEMESPAGLRFGPTIPCAIADAGPAITGAGATDFFGTARKAPFGAGHHEVDICQ